jgi:hypothetical protein
MQKKALYVRLKGIPEGVIFLSFNIAKTLKNKGLSVIARNEVTKPISCFYLSSLPFYVIPSQAGIHLLFKTGYRYQNFTDSRVDGYLLTLGTALYSPFLPVSLMEVSQYLFHG